MFYSLSQTNDSTYEFTTDIGIRYIIYLSSIKNLSYLFIGQDRLKEENFYYLILDNKGKDEGFQPSTVPVRLRGHANSDVFIMRTVALCLIQFFTDKPEAVVIFNYTNQDTKIKARRRLFKKWFDEYSGGSLYQYYQHDYADEASMLALYTRYSAHPNFAVVQDQIRDLIVNYMPLESKA